MFSHSDKGARFIKIPLEFDGSKKIFLEGCWLRRSKLFQVVLKMKLDAFNKTLRIDHSRQWLTIRVEFPILFGPRYCEGFFSDFSEYDPIPKHGVMRETTTEQVVERFCKGIMHCLLKKIDLPMEDTLKPSTEELSGVVFAVFARNVYFYALKIIDSQSDCCHIPMGNSE